MQRNEFNTGQLKNLLGYHGIMHLKPHTIVQQIILVLDKHHSASSRTCGI